MPINRPLRNRFKLLLPFMFYSKDASAQMVLQQARKMGVAVDAVVAGGIAARSRGTPRVAVRLLEACHRYARSLGDAAVSCEFAIAEAMGRPAPPYPPCKRGGYVGGRVDG